MFASRGEMLKYLDLQLLERTGHIRNLRRQVAYPLHINGEPILVDGRRAKYTADYIFLEPDENGTWTEIIADYKGSMTEASKLRIAVFEAIYGVSIRGMASKMSAPERRGFLLPCGHCCANPEVTQP